MCQNNWWKYLLFVNNWFPMNQVCLWDINECDGQDEKYSNTGSTVYYMKYTPMGQDPYPWHKQTLCSNWEMTKSPVTLKCSYILLHIYYGLRNPTFPKHTKDIFKKNHNLFPLKLSKIFLNSCIWQEGLSFLNSITFIKYMKRVEDVKIPLKLSNLHETLPDGMENCVILKLN